MRNIKDFYYNKAKQDKYPARSVYKLEEAQKKYHLLAKDNSVLDLGCRPGSWSLYAAKITGPKGLVVGVDLKEAAKEKTPGAANIQWFCSDIMAPDFLTILKQTWSKFHVVLSDMAPKTSGNKWVDQQRSLRLAERSLEIAEQMLYEGGNFFCKVFQGEDFPEFVNEVRKRFKMTKTIKPKSSRTESREVFVLAMGLKKFEG